MVLQALKSNPDATFAQVFSPGVLQRLACLADQEYEAFRLQYQAALVMYGFKPKFSTNDIDNVVTATAMRLQQQRKNIPSTPLQKACPTAPDAKTQLVIPGSFWLADTGVGIMQDPNTPGETIATAPVYIAAKIINETRAKMLQELKCYTQGKWRSAYIPASKSETALIRAAQDLGVLVLNHSALAQYFIEYKAVNWHTMPVLDTVPGDDLYELFIEHVLDNIDNFGTTHSERRPWGKFIQSQQNVCLAIIPKVVTDFLRRNKVNPGQALLSWRDKGFIQPDSAGKTSRTVSFHGYKRRMIVFPDFVTGKRLQLDNTTMTG